MCSAFIHVTAQSHCRCNLILCVSEHLGKTGAHVKKLMFGTRLAHNINCIRENMHLPFDYCLSKLNSHINKWLKSGKAGTKKSPFVRRNKTFFKNLPSGFICPSLLFISVQSQHKIAVFLFLFSIA